MRPPISARWHTTVLMALLLSYATQSQGKARGRGESLIIFLQQNSAVDGTFEKVHLPKIRRLADDSGIRVNVITIEDKAPKEITITPLIIFSNHLGRSIYQGRTTSIDRIKNFVRTSRYIPGARAPDERSNSLVWQNGRSRTWASIKITPLSGTLPPKHNEAQFVEESTAALIAGLRKFARHERVQIFRSDRGFYIDVYPWRSQGGALHLTLAVYSQFHCKKPVFTIKGSSLTDRWENRTNLFSRVARQAEEAIAKIISDPQSGDSYSALSSLVSTVTWEEMGLPLPVQAKKKTRRSKLTTKLGKYWRLEQTTKRERPMIQFRFPAPFEQYAGEVLTARGEITFDERLSPSSAKGFLAVETNSVTMGDKDLNKAIKGGSFLETGKFPEARFEINRVTSLAQTIDFGRLATGTVEGVFTLKGKRISLELPVDVEPIVGTDRKPRLIIRGTFGINLLDFEIQGADSNTPAGQSLVFDLYLVMTAKGSEEK